MSDSDGNGSSKGTRLPHLTRPGIDGEHPTDEVGPEEAAPGPQECEFSPGERSGEVHESEFKAADEMDEAFPVEQLATPIAADGLPDHSVDGDPTGTHPYTYQSVCCVADTRQYVELFDGEIAWSGDGDAPLPRQQGWSRHVDHKSGAITHRRHPLPYPIDLLLREPFDKQTGALNARRVYDPGEITEQWGHLGVPTREGFVPVRPIRERCIHFRRQHFGVDAQPVPGLPGHNKYFLNCAHPARRSIGGAAMSLSDEAIYGCDYRRPPDAEGVRHMNRFYQGKLDNSPHLTRLPIFGMAGEMVVQQKKEDLPS